MTGTLKLQLSFLQIEANYNWNYLSCPIGTVVPSGRLKPQINSRPTLKSVKSVKSAKICFLLNSFSHCSLLHFTSAVISKLSRKLGGFSVIIMREFG